MNQLQFMETECKQDLFYVDDLIEGLFLLMNSDESGPINIGNPKEFKIKELALLIIKMIENSNIIYLPLPDDDPKQRKPVIRIANTKLNWEPKVELNEGLIKTINYFRQLLLLKQ